jgi:hypothetical protein
VSVRKSNFLGVYITFTDDGILLKDNLEVYNIYYFSVLSILQIMFYSVDIIRPGYHTSA